MVHAAAIYCRISSDPKGEGLGVQRQEVLCRELAASKGWEVAEVYVDNDVSAYSRKPRPQYERLLVDLDEGRRDGVIVLDQDRLVRQTRELETFMELADRMKVALANVAGDLDLSSSDGRFRARIMGAVAQHESDKKSERLRRQRDQAARMGRPHGGRRAFGYRRDGLTVDEGEAVYVREAVRRVLEGESLRDVARDWNACGVKPVYADTWRVTSLRSLLASPRIAGLRVHRGEIVGEAQWPALVDRADWERIREILGDPRRRRAGRPPSEPHLLSGLLRCGRCGQTLYHGRRSDTGSRRYACDQHPGSGGCGGISVAAEPVEEFVGEQVIVALASDDLAVRLAQLRSAGPDAAEATLDLEAVERERVKLGEAYGRGEIPLSVVTAAQPELERREIEARRILAASVQAPVLEGLPAAHHELEAWWASHEADVDRRRTVVSAVVESVVVNPGRARGRKVDPDRVKLVWRA